MDLCGDAKLFVGFMRQQENLFTKQKGNAIKLLGAKCGTMQHIKSCPDCEATDKEIQKLTGLPVTNEYLTHKLGYVYESKQAD
jgi:hypothetical protein